MNSQENEAMQGKMLMLKRMNETRLREEKKQARLAHR